MEDPIVPGTARRMPGGRQVQGVRHCFLCRRPTEHAIGWTILERRQAPRRRPQIVRWILQQLGLHPSCRRRRNKDKRRDRYSQYILVCPSCGKNIGKEKMGARSEDEDVDR